jgi:uncharacterized zinc-type alcohol dehydrogenase-like protein
MVVTPMNTWPARISSTTCPPDWIRRPWRRCSAPALLPGHRCGIAHALGAKVVVFTTSPGKCSDALALGADEAILSTDAEAMAAQKYRFRFILDTVSSRHHLDPYLLALDMDGTLCCLGIPDAMDFTPVLLTMGRRRLSSSGSAGTRETQEMLDFCGEHGITADVEIIAASAIEEGFTRLEKGEVRYRLVIDMATLSKPVAAA